MTKKSRFAPSPTGLLHIGNVRSALINWAHISSLGGEFILRIDDTDKERSKREFENHIKEDLKWLGLNWNKSFNQSDRIDIYNDKIEILKSKKRLYPCFETTEELALKKKSLLMAGKPPIYDRSSLNLNAEEVNSLIKKGKKPHWRFKLEDKTVSWNDLIKGDVNFELKNFSDPILIREDGSLLYHLPSVIDDIEEKITDIIRGEDHISNTVFHIQIFESLESSLPKFGHHPLLKDEKGSSFGKRLGSLSLKSLREKGFENITISNCLLSFGTSENIMKFKNLNLIKDNFKIKNLSNSSSKFSSELLKQINREILQSYEFNEIKDNFKKINLENVNEDFWKFCKNNIDFFSDAIFWWNIINSSEYKQNQESEFLKTAINLLPQEPFDINTWAEWTSKISEKTKRTGKNLYMPLRLALTGLEKGPELRYLMPLLNKDLIKKKLGF